MRIILIFCMLLISACAKQAPINNPQAASINTKLGYGYMQEGNTPRAKEKFLLAYRQDPSSAAVLAGLAYFYAKTHQLKLANVFYQRAVKASPKNGAVYNNYGVFLCQQKQYRQAEYYFHLAMKMPNYMNAQDAAKNAKLCA